MVAFTYDMLIEVGEVYIMRVLSQFFFGVTTIEAHHSVASVTFMVMFCASSKSISCFSLLW